VKQFVVLVLVYFTMYQKMCAFRIFGDLVNYTFLETLLNLKNNVYIFPKNPMATILDFQNGVCLFWNPAIGLSPLLSIIDTWLWCLNIHYWGQGI